MSREGVSFFGTSQGTEVALCERAGVESCDGVGPVVPMDTGGIGAPDMGPTGPGIDASGPVPPLGDDALSNGSSDPAVVRGEGGCCTQLPRREPASPSLGFAVALCTICRISRRGSKRPA